MATGFIFGSFITDEANGNASLGVDTVKVMLLTSTAAPDKDAWATRADVTNEHAATGGYTAGGETVVPTIGAYDSVADDIDITLPGNTWSSSTISAQYAIYYISNGGAASGDPVVACVDQGTTISSSGGNWTLASSTFTKNAPSAP